MLFLLWFGKLLYIIHITANLQDANTSQCPDMFGKQLSCHLCYSWQGKSVRLPYANWYGCVSCLFINISDCYFQLFNYQKEECFLDVSYILFCMTPGWYVCIYLELYQPHTYFCSLLRSVCFSCSLLHLFTIILQQFCLLNKYTLQAHSKV